MQCPVCGGEAASGDSVCPHCRANLKRVQILSAEERENFQGTTIEVEPPGAKTNRGAKSGFHRRKAGGEGWTREDRAPFPGVWVFHSILAGIAGMLFLASVILILTVFAWPIALFILAILAVTWLLRHLRY